jgi:hypothetical protein
MFAERLNNNRNQANFDGICVVGAHCFSSSRTGHAKTMVVQKYNVKLKCYNFACRDGVLKETSR